MRKTHVQVPQSAYLDLLKTIHHKGEPRWCVLDDLAIYFGVHVGTARRKLDGLVAQGKVEAKSNRGRGPKEYRYVRNER